MSDDPVRRSPPLAGAVATSSTDAPTKASSPMPTDTFHDELWRLAGAASARPARMTASAVRRAAWPSRTLIAAATASAKPVHQGEAARPRFAARHQSVR